MRRRRTFNQVRAQERGEVFAEVCRIIKHRYGQEKMADEIWQWFNEERTGTYLTPNVMQRMEEQSIYLPSVDSSLTENPHG